MKFKVLFIILSTFGIDSKGIKEINAVTKTQRYMDFVEPFLQLFINPKDGKSMKIKISKMHNKYFRYTQRFEKYYNQCGNSKRTRRSSTGRQEAERAFLKDIADTLLLMKAQKTIKEKNIGDLTAYECTVENMEHLWHKINAGFRRNFNRYLKTGRCSTKVLTRLQQRLSIDGRKVSRFIRVHRSWLN